jgi:hypothetical protein
MHTNELISTIDEDPTQDLLTSWNLLEMPIRRTLEAGKPVSSSGVCPHQNNTEEEVFEGRKMIAL